MICCDCENFIKIWLSGCDLDDENCPFREGSEEE